jgi:hypothetical protein
MGEWADQALDNMMDGWLRAGRPRPRVQYTTCRRCNKPNLLWREGKCWESDGEEHSCQLTFKRRLEAVKDVPHTPEPYRTMLIEERASRLMSDADSNPEVGFPLTWPVAVWDAERQLIRERKISS